jgi:hypothetical protein
VDPPGERDGLADVGSAEFVAVVRSVHGGKLGGNLGAGSVRGNWPGSSGEIRALACAARPGQSTP